MKVLFLSRSARAPSTRYRVSLLLPLLKDAGIEAEHRVHRSGVVQGIPAVRAAARFDVVVVHRCLFSRPFLAGFRRRAKRLVFDFDDAIHVSRSGTSRTREKRFAAMMSNADLVVAGNHHLKDQAGRFGAQNVKVVPTVLDPAPYPGPATGDGSVTGWIGTGGNLRYLEPILPLLKRTGVKKLRVICDRFPASPPIDIERRTWSEATEASDLAGVDIGLAPLADDEWTRGKCGFKILQYMAAGIPVVASPVGVQSEIVVEGETGYLAGDDNGWVRAIRELSKNRAKREKFGRAGRLRVEKQYSNRSAGAHWVRILKELVS